MVETSSGTSQFLDNKFEAGPPLFDSKSDIVRKVAESYAAHAGQSNITEQMQKNISLLNTWKHSYSERRFKQLKNTANDTIAALSEFAPVSGSFGIDMLHGMKISINYHEQIHAHLPDLEKWHNVSMNVLGGLPMMVEGNEVSKDEAQTIVSVYNLMTNHPVSLDELFRLSSRESSKIWLASYYQLLKLEGCNPAKIDQEVRDTLKYFLERKQIDESGQQLLLDDLQKLESADEVLPSDDSLKELIDIDKKQLGG